MANQWLMNDGIIRLSATLGLLVFFALIELLAPRKERVMKRQSRWFGNFSLQILNLLVLRLMLPWLMPVSIAVLVSQERMGLFNWLNISGWLSLMLSLLMLDLAIYWQHRLTHKIPLLWRLHRVHHTDIDVDVTTALRFHPLEIIVSMLIKSTLVIIFGIKVDAIILFAVLLNGMAMFNHANIQLPLALDRILRYWVVTPDMHRVHHSVLHYEHDSNFGFNLSCWDRLFHSYRAQPELGHRQMLIGLNETNGQRTGSVMWMLKQPFD